MDFFNPSLNTLLLALIIPFVYFGYHAKYFYDEGKLKRSDFLLSSVALILSVVVLMKLFKSGGRYTREEMQLTLMHLAPLMLTLLIIARGRGSVVLPRSIRNKIPEQKKEAGYTPQAMNKEIQKLGWSDLIIDQELRDELSSIIDLLKDPKQSKRYGIEVPKGILFEGPPGTGKTTIAKVIANIAHLNFFVLSMDEVISKWVGESEKNLTKLFETAKRNAPAIIFIDEVDTIGRARSKGGQSWSENLLNHLLQLIDGVIKTEGIYVIAATNRADLVDDALKRAGRLTRTVHIPLPDYAARAEIFKLYLKKLNLEPGVDVELLAHRTEGRSAADLKEICNQAGLNAFKRESGQKSKNYLVTHKDLSAALEAFVPGQRAS